MRNGGPERDRTADLCNAIATLSQLSYGPLRIKSFSNKAKNANLIKKKAELNAPLLIFIIFSEDRVSL